MKKKNHISVFSVVNTFILVSLAAFCIVPLLHVLALSLSSSEAASSGRVFLWPVGFNFDSYEFLGKRSQFWRSMGITITRVIIGGAINTFLAILCAYPLSKTVSQFKYRTFYAWFFFVTMIFNGGLIPWFMIVKQLNLLDTIWALILPGAVPVFNVILLLNFFRQIPQSLSEAAYIDGANHFTALFKIYVPLSMPAIATILLFSLVNHWNSWFDGLLFMNKPNMYPLQTYLQTVIVQKNFDNMTQEQVQALMNISDKTMRSAQIFLGSLPIVAIYPFLQKFFVKGIVLGGVKG